MDEADDFHVNVSHPIGASLAAPLDLHVQVVQSVSVQLHHQTCVPFADLVVAAAAAHLHAYGDVVAQVRRVVVIAARKIARPQVRRQR